MSRQFDHSKDDLCEIFDLKEQDLLDKINFIQRQVEEKFGSTVRRSTMIKAIHADENTSDIEKLILTLQL